MNTDIRVSIGLTTHPKTIKLMRRCGDRAFFSLISLWLWAAQFRPDGVLSGMDQEDIEISAGWQGETGKFSSELIALHFIDEADGVYCLHDWAEHNSWAAKAEERGDQARFSRLARTNPELYEKLKSQGISSISKEDYERLTTNVQRPKNERKTREERKDTKRFTPAPAPSPTPNVIKSKEEGGVGETKTPQKPPVDNSPKELFQKQEKSKPLKELFSKVLERWPVNRDCNWYLWLQLHNRSHPEAIIHTFESLLKHGDTVENPIAYCNRVILMENQNYNARDHETETANKRASKTEAAQAMAHIGEILSLIGGKENLHEGEQR